MRPQGESRPRTVRGRDGGAEEAGTFPGRIDCYGLSETGSSRPINEDQFLIAPLFPDPREAGRPAAFLFVVADGLGGPPSGERASSIAIRTLHQSLEEAMPRLLAVPDDDTERADPGALLLQAVLQGQRDIEADREGHSDREGMGTTLTAALVLWPQAYVVHVGDSRCYRVRRSRPEQVTVDHTVAQRLAQLGVLSPEQAAGSRWRNILSNVLGGTSSRVDPQLTVMDLRWGDALLLSTDGVSDVLAEEALRLLLHRGGRAEAICRRLARAAQERGGKDDRTVVYVRFARSPLWRRLRALFFRPS